jgi:hypothetical protein
MRNNSLMRLCAVILLSAIISSPLQAAGAESTQSVEERLQDLADQFSLGPTTGDEVTTSVEANGNTLRFNHRVKDEVPFSLLAKHRFLVKELCTGDALLNLFQEGAAFENFYSRPNGETLGVSTVSQTECEAHAAGEPVAIQALTTGYIGRTLQNWAANRKRERVNEHYTIIGARARGTTLRTSYHFDGPFLFDLEEVFTGQVEQTLKEAGVRRFIEAGAVLEYFYSRPNGEVLGLVTIDQKMLEAYVEGRPLPGGRGLRSQDLKYHLQDLADRFPLGPSSDDEAIVSAKVDGNVLLVSNHLREGVPINLASKQMAWAAALCKSDDYLELFKGGAAYEIVYARPDGDALGSFLVDLLTCEAQQTVQAIREERALAPHLVEAMLLELARIARPKAVTANLSLIGAGVRDLALRTTYHVADAAHLHLNERRLVRLEKSCTSDLSSALIENGAIFEHFFTRPEGQELGLISIDQAACEAYANAQ